MGRWKREKDSLEQQTKWLTEELDRKSTQLLETQKEKVLSSFFIIEGGLLFLFTISISFHFGKIRSAMFTAFSSSHYFSLFIICILILCINNLF